MGIDWASARLDYVIHHELTYADIAAKYHAAHSTIHNRACSEGWTAERKEASKNVVEEVRKRPFSASLRSWHAPTSVI
jgi:uncharacterized protein YjcR